MPNNSNIFKYLGQDYPHGVQIQYDIMIVCPEKLIIREKEGKRRQRFQEILPHDEKCKKSYYIIIVWQ